MLILESQKWSWADGKTPEGLRKLVLLQMGCPAGCHHESPLRGGVVRIERSNPRSLTLACGQCDLHWTMTVHQLAKAASRWEWTPLLARDDSDEAAWVAYLAELDAEVPETRGRRKASGEGIPVDTP